MVDVPDSKSGGVTPVWVRVPRPAPGADVKQIERQRQEAHHNVLPNLNVRSEP